MTPNDWEEKESLEWGGEWWSDKQRVWSVWLCPSFVFGLRGGRLAEAGRLAALAQSQATHCATLPWKSPGLRGTGGWGGTSSRSVPPPMALQQAPGGLLCPHFNHLTHLVPSAWWGLVHLGSVLWLWGCKPVCSLTWAGMAWTWLDRHRSKYWG